MVTKTTQTAIHEAAAVPLIGALTYLMIYHTDLPYLFIVVADAFFVWLAANYNSLTFAKAVKGFLLLVTHIFFREIGSRGAHRIPKEGPVVFVCAPHSNQFLDPIMVLQTVGRDVGFLAAAKSMRRRWVGMLGRALGSIQVERAQDLAKSGKGKVTTTEQGKYIHGDDITKFTQHIKAGFTVVVKGEALTISKVHSDTEAETTGSPQLEQDAKTPTKWSYAPKIDQHEVFENVWKHLKDNKCVGVFPEGGSHDRSDLLPFKAGVTIMALGAMHKYKDLDVKIVPVGLNYFSGHRFRSRAFVDVGDPIVIPRELAEAYGAGGDEKRNACSKLLDIIQKRLKAVTVTAPNHEVLQMIWAVRRLYSPENVKLTIEQKLELTRRFEDAYHRLEDDHRMHEIRAKVERYNRHLNAFGLRDHQVARTTWGRLDALPLFLWRVLVLCCYTVFALPGALLNLPVIIIARVISSKKAKEAKAASNVKLTGRDVLATWKLMISMALVPVVFIIYPVIAALVGHFTGYGATRVWGYFAILQPFFMYGSVRFVEVGRQIASSLIPLFFAIVGMSGGDKLLRERQELQKTIRDMAEQLGPEVFGPEEFDRIRVVKRTDFHRKKNENTGGFALNKIKSWSNLNFTLSNKDSYDDADADMRSPGSSNSSSWSEQSSPYSQSVNSR